MDDLGRFWRFALDGNRGSYARRGGWSSRQIWILSGVFGAMGVDLSNLAVAVRKSSASAAFWADCLMYSDGCC
eukprot:scaffold14356_cov194-Skeletonema_marinoi.AAC.2